MGQDNNQPCRRSSEREEVVLAGSAFGLGRSRSIIVSDLSTEGARLDARDMPAPGDGRPARFHVHLHDLLWDTLYAPVARFINVTADALNRVQFLTIRGYLTLVSGALVALLVILAVWQ